MPQPPSRVATINLGMQTVTMAVFDRADGGGLTLSAYNRADLIPDPAADASRLGQLKVVLGEMRSKLGWKGATCACAIPSQGVFTRFVQIPKVEPDKVDQVLLFEAQQNIPYPIEDVAWTYQLLSSRSDDRLDALIVATKTDALEAAAEALATAKLVPTLIETSPTALYNAFRFSYPEAAGCSLLIDIGARATNLLFIEGSDLFVRTLPVGGSSITAALEKRFEGRAFTEMEDFKRAEGLIPPPGNYSGAKNEDIAEMGKIARTVMTRIHNEITRSVTFYRTTQKGAAPMRVFLAGGGVSMPYTLEFFNEKLSLPIEFFNPLRRIRVAPTVDASDLSRSAHLLGECVGLALQILLGDCPVEVSLKPPSLEAAALIRRRMPFIMTAMAAVAAGIIMIGAYYKGAANQVAAINSGIRAASEPLQRVSEKIAAAVRERDKLLEENADLVAAPVLRTGWSDLVDELNQSLPAKSVWITKLAPYPAIPEFSEEAEGGAAPPSGEQEDGSQDPPSVTHLLVDGLYIENEMGPALVDEFVEKLSQSPLFDITGENKSEVVKVRAAQSGDQWAYQYSLLVPLKRPIPL